MVGTFLAGLASLAKPVLARVLLALGMSVVTIGGISVALSQLKQSALLALGQAPLAMLQLAGYAGCWTALGILMGAMTFCVGFWTLTKATSILGTSA